MHARIPSPGSRSGPRPLSAGAGRLAGIAMPVGLLFSAMLATPALAQSAPKFPETLTNSATLTYNNVTDPSPEDNTGEDENRLTLDTDVSVVKTLVTQGPFRVGQQVTYTLAVTNTGALQAQDIVLNDVPQNLTNLVVNGGADSTCTAFPCPIPTLAANATITFQVTATIAGVGAFANSANIDLPDYHVDPDTGNNTTDGGGGMATGPKVNVAVDRDTVQEDGTETLTFTVTLDEPATTDTVVVLDFGGTATAGDDYDGMVPSITIPAGETTVSFPVTPKQDALVEGTETIVVNVVPNANYELGDDPSVTASIIDAASAAPDATLSVAPDRVSEDGGQALVYTVQLSAPAQVDTVINLTYGGTADPATDYTGSQATITIPAGSSSGTVSLMPVQDDAFEPDETVVVTLGAGTGYAIASADGVVGTITNDDMAKANLSITKTDNAGTYVPGGNGVYTVVVSNAGPDAATGVVATDNLPKGVTLSAAWSCTASNGQCVQASGGAVGDSTVTVTVDLENGGQATITIPVKFSANPADYY